MISIVEPVQGRWNNFHTHTFRCGHAEGDAGEFAAKAASLGMTKVGICDHAYIQGEGKHPLHMGKEDIPDYIHACKEADGAYGGVKVFCGVECDYDPSDEAFFTDYYLGEQGMDYLVGSVHWLKNQPDVMDCFANTHFGVKQLRIYTDLYVRMLESRRFTFCAHPDLFCRPIQIGEDPQGWDANAVSAAREILEAAGANRAVLEINVSGVWKTVTRGHCVLIYPMDPFWEMAADYHIPVIVNTDAHSLERLDAYADHGLKLCEKYGLHRVELG